MTANQAWNTIVEKLKGGTIELRTVPKTKKTPVWFTASTDGHVIFVNKAINNILSSNLSMERKLTYKTFEKVYLLYLKQEKGEVTSSEVNHITVDQVYFFSLIKYLC